MAKTGFVPDLSGYRELMRSSGVRSLIDKAADQMVEKASAMTSTDEMDREPFKYLSGVDEVAAYATVFTNSPHGRNAEAKNKVLTKAYKSTGV